MKGNEGGGERTRGGGRAKKKLESLAVPIVLDRQGQTT